MNDSRRQFVGKALWGGIAAGAMALVPDGVRAQSKKPTILDAITAEMIRTGKAIEAAPDDRRRVTHGHALASQCRLAALAFDADDLDARLQALMQQQVNTRGHEAVVLSILAQPLDSQVKSKMGQRGWALRHRPLPPLSPDQVTKGLAAVLAGVGPAATSRQLADALDDRTDEIAAIIDPHFRIVKPDACTAAGLAVGGASLELAIASAALASAPELAFFLTPYIWTLTAQLAAALSFEWYCAFSQ